MPTDITHCLTNLTSGRPFVGAACRCPLYDGGGFKLFGPATLTGQGPPGRAPGSSGRGREKAKANPLGSDKKKTVTWLISSQVRFRGQQDLLVHGYRQASP